MARVQPVVFLGCPLSQFLPTTTQDETTLTAPNVVVVTPACLLRPWLLDSHPRSVN